MFSVYGSAGRLYRGSMEEMRQVGRVNPLARTHAVEPVGRDGRDGWSRPLPDHAAALPTDGAHRDALAAYAQTQRGDGQRHPLTRVDALMSRSVVTVSDTMTVLEAWQLLGRHGIGQAPVVNATLVLVGLLSRASMLIPEQLPALDSGAQAWHALLARNVADIMWTPIPSVAIDTDIRRVARVLLDTGLPGLPVADEEGRVTGFVSRSDILRAVVTDPPLDLWG